MISIDAGVGFNSGVNDSVGCRVGIRGLYSVNKIAWLLVSIGVVIGVNNSVDWCRCCVIVGGCSFVGDDVGCCWCLSVSVLVVVVIVLNWCQFLLAIVVVVHRCRCWLLSALKKKSESSLCFVGREKK